MSELEEALPYARNLLSKFCGRALDYAKYRPSYPAAAIDILLEGMETPPHLVAADVGAGTGISSRLLAERGVRVIAIEPNADMRQVAVSHPLVEFRDATAEATGLPDASVDLVTCFQSFHWFRFNLEPTLLEFNRIVKPSGKLVAVWNDLDENDEFTANYSHLLRTALNNLPNAGEREDPNLKDRVMAVGSVVNIQHLVFPYRQDVDLTGLIGWARSQSVVPLEGPVLQQIISDSQQLHAHFCDERGMVSLLYRTSVFLAKPR